MGGGGHGGAMASKSPTDILHEDMHTTATRSVELSHATCKNDSIIIRSNN